VLLGAILNHLIYSAQRNDPAQARRFQSYLNAVYSRLVAQNLSRK